MKELLRNIEGYAEFKRGEIYYYDFGIREGSIQSGHGLYTVSRWSNMGCKTKNGCGVAII